MLTRHLTTNIHLDQVTAALGPVAPQPGFSPPDIDFLFLLFTNRCGSNLLAQILASTGRFNEAGEYFNGNTIVDHVRAQTLASLQDYVRLLPRLIGRQDRITVKLGIEHIELLDQAGLLQTILPRSRCILLERRDILAQAISRVIASQNLHWTTEHPSRLRDDQLVYSRARIEEELSRTKLGNRLLYSFLREAGIAPLHFYYENLVATPQGHLDEIAAWLKDVGLHYNSSLIRIRRQANSINEAWRELYLSGAE